jgi:hypothetical protein
MAKRRRSRYGTLMGGALALPLGATVIGALPSSAVTTNTLSGMSQMSSMFPTMGKLAGVGMTLNVTGELNKALKKLS